jgi:hypothetical protein
MLSHLQRDVENEGSGAEMTLVGFFYALPLGSAVLAGAAILAYLIYMNSEFHPSARPRRTPRD